VRDISLHLLDLMENSLRAGAAHVECDMRLSEEGMLDICLRDDGCGMDPELQQSVLSPFGTTRTTRKVGLGIPLTAANAEKTGGALHIHSVPGQGTTLNICFNTRHMDCLPLGDVAQTLWTLVITHPLSPEFTLTLASPQGESRFSTEEIRSVLGAEIPLNEPEVSAYLRDLLVEQAQTIFGGLLL